jgi:hypothetical protein
MYVNIDSSSLDSWTEASTWTKFRHREMDLARSSKTSKQTDCCRRRESVATNKMSKWREADTNTFTV